MNRFIVALFLLLSSGFVFADSYILFQVNGKVGLKNQDGVVVIPAEYDQLGWSEGEFKVIDRVIGFRQNELWGLITVTNQKITKAEYYTLAPAEGNWVIASKRSPLSLRITSGVIDTSGKIIIPFNYSGIKINALRAIVYSLDGNRLKYGLIDMSNKTILPQQYQVIYPIGSLRYAVRNFDNKTALFTENGSAITSFEIDSISTIQKGLAIFYQNGKQGLINRDGQIIQSPTLREIKLIDGNYFARASNTWFVLDAHHTQLQKLEVDSIARIGNQRMKVVTSAGTQLTDLQLQPIITPQIDILGSFKNGMASYIKNGKQGVIRNDGSPVLAAAYDHVVIDNQFIIACQQLGNSNKCHLFDASGKQITKKDYNSISLFNGSFFVVTKNRYQGGIDKNGKEILACAYDSIIESYDNRIVVRFRKEYGIIDLNERWIVVPQPNRIRLINSERYFEYQGDQTFLKTMDGVMVYFTTNPIQPEGNTLIENVSNGGKWTINLNGQIIHREYPSQEMVEQIFPSTEGMRMIIRNGKAGFVDDLGRLRISNRYEDARPFKDGLAAIRIRGKWGFINREDKIVVQPVFDNVYQFVQGQCVVQQNGKYGLINSSGKYLLECRYDQLTVLPNKRILLKTGQDVGLADEHGNLLIQPRYESIEDFNNGFARVQLNTKFGLVNLQGVSTIPIKYDQLFFEPETNRYLACETAALKELNLNN
jgi:hypothetical protein